MGANVLEETGLVVDPQLLLLLLALLVVLVQLAHLVSTNHMIVWFQSNILSYILYIICHT